MYTYPLYRPPSEAKSLIIQITEGCSYNKCRFCYMYKNKKFRVKNDEEIEKHLVQLKLYYKDYLDMTKRAFLADGNVMCLNTTKLLSLLSKIKQYFPGLERISCYSSAKDILNKSDDELIKLKLAGLDMLYIGIESGDDEVLKLMEKGSSQQDMVDGCIRAKKVGFTLSCMIISGLGGQKYFKEHAIQSAKVISSINPNYFGLLSLTVDKNSLLSKDINDGKFVLLSPKQIIEENIIMLENVYLENCIFRANHISNHVILKGTLDQDKQQLIDKLLRLRDNDNFISQSIHGL